MESLVQQIYYPDFYKKISIGSAESRKQALSELYNKSLPVYIILMFFVLALAPQLTGLLVAHNFAVSAKFVAFGALIEFFRMTSNVLAAAAHSEMRTPVLIKPYAIGGVFTCLAVYAATLLPLPAAGIPLALLAGGVITFFAIKSGIARIAVFKFDRTILYRAVLYSCPFLLFLIFKRGSSALAACLILLPAGLYFLFLQYSAVFKWREAPRPQNILKTIDSGSAVRADLEMRGHP